MKIVITGGTGAMAKPGILYFLDQSDVKEILITGRTKKKVDEAVAWFKNDRVKGMVLDLMDIEACAKAFKGADVVNNAAYLSTCLSVTTAALKAGANYVDLGGNSHWDQMKMHDDFIKIGKTAVLGLGTAPGMSAMMPAVVIENMDSVDTIEIKDICKNMVPHSEHSRPLHWGYSLEGILDEASMDAPILIDGKVEWHPARSFKEYVEFLPPAGGGNVGITIHPEVEMFVHSWTKKGLKNASWKIGFEEDFEQKLRFLSSLGLAHPDNRIVYNGQEICPRDVVLAAIEALPPESKKEPNFRGHMIAFVKGIEKGEPVSYKVTEYATAELTDKMRSRGIYSSYRTGLYAAIGVLMLGRNMAKEKGVLFPQDSLPADKFMKEVIDLGIDVSIERCQPVEM